MKDDRIFFPENPWPEGHGIKEFSWTAEIIDSSIWFHFDLQSDNYYAEREIEDDEDTECSDWEAPIVWGNYHACTISSNQWHAGGFKVCSVADFSLERLDGMQFHIDPLPLNLREHDPEQLAFHTYLLGHDTVVDHQIAFHRISGTDLFNIVWSGKIALTYAGHYEPDHEFHAKIHSLVVPSFSI